MEIKEKIEKKVNSDEQKNKSKMNKAINQLGENYINMERSIVEQLKMMTTKNPLTTGTYREEVWKSMFERMIPKKYCIDQSVFIIDSEGFISDEVDLAIFDEMYTPYIFKYKNIKFIPVEAVAIVIQCKSVVRKNKKMDDNLIGWLDSINKLVTSNNSVARTMSGFIDNTIKSNKRNFQTGTRPIKILCATQIKDDIADSLLKREEKFDLIVSTKDNRLKMYIDKANDDKEGDDDKENKNDFLIWHRSLNHNKSEEEQRKYTIDIDPNRNLENLKVKDKDGNENVIMSLTFQLNQLLMIINNPMLFPHKAYVDMFNREFQNYKK
jgi:hypothetical protein